MTSLTPDHKKDHVVDNAVQDGAMNALLTLIPSVAGVYALVKQSPWFAKSTNLQARTAIAIMPAFFVFTFSAEESVVSGMRNMAKQNQHSHDSMQWAEKQLDPGTAAVTAHHKSEEQQKELNALYKRAVYESGVRVIPGNELSVYHIASNYVAENPFKVLSSLAVPGVAWIFYGRSGQEHLTFSMKLMHTRVFGQFATISALLGVMGFKAMMDSQGKFITEAQAEARVQEMQDLRLEMLARLEAGTRAQKAYEDAIHKAHDEDVKEGHEIKHKKKHRHHKKREPAEKPVVASESGAMAVSPKTE